MPFEPLNISTKSSFEPIGIAPTPDISEESGFFGEMGKGLVRGFLNVGSGLVGTAEWAVPGQQESWLKAKENIQSAASRFPVEDRSWEGWAGRVLGEAFPYMGTALVAGYAGAGIAGGIAGAGTAGLTGQAAALGGGLAAKAPFVGALIGSASIGFAVEGQQAYDNAITHGASDNEANAERLIVGTINAAIEATQISRLMKFHKTGALSLGEFIRNIRNKAWDLIGGDAKKFTGQVLKTALEEGLEESLQEGVSISVPGFIRGDYPKNEDGTINWSGILTRIGEAGIGGGFAGGVLGGAGAVVGASPELGRLTNKEIDKAIEKVKSYKMPVKEQEQWVSRLEDMKRKISEETPTVPSETPYTPKEQENVYRGKDTGKVYYEPTGKWAVQTTRMETVSVESTTKVEPGTEAKPKIWLPTAKGYVQMPKSYLRFGVLPEGGITSTNWLTGKSEKGVSVFEGWYDPKTKKFVLATGGDSLTNTLDEFTEGKDKLYLIEGKELVDVGGVGETLLDSSTGKVIREISFDDVVTDSDRNVTLSGKDLSKVETPDWSTAQPASTTEPGAEVFYHGSPKEGLAEIKPGRGDYGYGVYLASERRARKDYAPGRKNVAAYVLGDTNVPPPEGFVYPVQSPVKNPLVINTEQEYTKLLDEHGDSDKGIGEFARKAGYDGIINNYTEEHIVFTDKPIPVSKPETRNRVVSVETGEELEQAHDLERRRGESEEAYLARTQPVKSDVPSYNKEWDEQLTNAVNQLDVSLRKEHEEKIRRETGIKVNVAQNFLKEREDIPPELRFMASTHEIRGNLKLEFEPLKFDQDHISYYYQKILIHPDAKANYFLGLHATEGLNAIFGMEKDRHGKAILPEPYQIKALEKIFGPHLAEKLFKLREGNRTALSKFKELLNFPRAVLASMDMSAGGRQGLLLLPIAPKQWIKAIGQGYRAWTSPQYSSYIDLQIKSDPIYKVWKKYGGHFSELGSMDSGEEFWTSRLAHKIPGIPASERAFTTTLNSLRFYTFKKFYTSWQGSGKANTDYKLLAEFINHATGRGDIKGLEKYVPFLNLAFFAPRLQMGRIQSLGDLFRGSAKELKTGQLSMTRKLIAADLVAAFGGGMGVLFLLSLIKGIDVEKDPRSSDFGKIRFGNTRIDFWGGYSQMARLLAQMAVAETKGTDSKRIMSAERGDVVWRYIQTKLSPAAGMAVDLARGETFLGEKLEVSPEKVAKQIHERFTPLFMQDVTDALRYQGMTSAAIVAPLVFHGIGAMTYPKKASSESGRIKDTISKETFGVGWDDLGPVGQKLLMQNKPEIELAERQARIERENFDMVSKRIEEQQDVTKKMINHLPVKVKEEIKTVNAYIPGLTRHISNGWFLNDKRYLEYQKNTTIAMSLYLTKLMNLPAYKNAEPEMRALLIEEVVEDIRKRVRDKITQDATIEDFQHIRER